MVIKSNFLSVIVLIAVSATGWLQTPLTASAQTIPVHALTTGPTFHWFGYYDKLQFDPTHRYALGMEVDFEHRSPTKDDVLKIGMIDLKDNNRWIELGESRSWGWQQGCMLQWVPGSDSEVIWNDRQGDRFISIVKDIHTGQQRILSKAIYALSPDGKYAIGTDFARIQNYRKGYGYPGGTDPYKHDNGPDTSGIYRIDLETGQSKLLLSYKAISQIPNAGKDISEKWHYFNHLLVSPDGKRFIFLNRWRDTPIADDVLANPDAYNKVRGHYTTRMFTAGMDGNDVFLLDPSGRTSHFIWKNDESSRLITWELLRAVKQRGVRVQILADHFVSSRDIGAAAFLATIDSRLELKAWGPIGNQLRDDPVALEIGSRRGPVLILASLVGGFFALIAIAITVDAWSRARREGKAQTE